LYGHEEPSLYGAAALLDIDRIPYRRLAGIGDLDEGETLLVAGELARGEVAAVMRGPAVVLNGGTHFAELAFGRHAAVRTQPAALSLDAGLWPAPLARRLGRFRRESCSLPLAPVCELSRDGNGQPAGMTRQTGSCQPAVLVQDECVWSPLDLGAAFTHLITEDYVREDAHAFNELPLRRSLESFYYSIPAWMRRRVQALSYQRAQRTLDTAWPASEYPVDDTGNILIELLKGLLQLSGVSLLALCRWPSPHQSAALMTHDIEPSRYAYRVGLRRLLDRQRPSDHPILGLVSEPAARHLDDDLLARMSRFDVLCHGLTHLGESVADSQRLGEMRARLEAKLQRRVRGYRSPRLSRSSDLMRALDLAGFEYDSSFPDIDRETLSRYGAGVRLNIPFRPPIETGTGKLRPSRCLELPLCAPDCVQPLFAGETMAALQQCVRAKAAHVRAGGGLYVALVHAGVFGDRDAELREQHRRFVARELSAGETWLPHIRELLDWWRARENLTITWRRGTPCVHNSGHRTVHHVRAVVDDGRNEFLMAVPPVEPGATVALARMPKSAPARRPLDMVA
jgi:hypothetical protein